MTGRRALGFDGRPFDVAEVLRFARVTDHALVRYLERVEGYPVAAVRQAMLINPTVLQALALGASAVQLPELGVRMVIQDRRILTLTPLKDDE